MKKKLFIVFSAAVVLWAVIGVIDYGRVHSFEKPIFCAVVDTADDGGSGNYVGLGYSFDIQGNFMSEDEYPGVTKWTYYLFGKEIKTGIRE